jgi:hypothetical protein
MRQDMRAGTDPVFVGMLLLVIVLAILAAASGA